MLLNTNHLADKKRPEQNVFRPLPSLSRNIDVFSELINISA